MFTLIHAVVVRFGFQEQHALDDLVGVLGLFDQLVLHVLRELVQTPVAQLARMAQVLVASGELAVQQALQVFEDLRVTFHR
jgi:hypothetical protein